MTSNMGSHLILENFEKESNTELAASYAKQEVLTLLKQQLRPEFLNRIDDIVMFSPLTKEDITQIVDIQLKALSKMLLEQNINIDATDDAKALLANEGFEPEFGARPVKRTIQKLVLNELSKQLLGAKIDSVNGILIDENNNKIVFKNV